MGKKLFSGDLRSLPNNLRCRRSDGKKWRCTQPAKSGLSYCEYHYHRLHQNQDSKKNTDLTAEASAKPKRRPLLTADPPLAKKRRRKRPRKDRLVTESIGSEKMKEGVVEREFSDEKVNMDLPSPVLRPHKSDVRKCRCSPPAMTALNSECCSPRIKQPNEKDATAIKRSPEPRPRRAVNLMPWIMRRQWQRPKKSLEEEPVRMLQWEDGESNKAAAEPAVTKVLSIDPLRCRRSDGRKWQCPQPVMLGFDLCEHHLMRCKQTYNTNPKVKIAMPDRGSNLAAGDLIRTEQNEEGLEAAKPVSPGLIFCDKDPLCCKEHNNTSKTAEPAMLSMEAAEPATPDVEPAKPAAPDMEAAEPVTPDLCVTDNDLLCREEDNNKIKEAFAKPSCRLYLPSDPQPSKKNHSISDQLRCRRSDGRKWRCPQLAMPSICFCEYHFLQMRHNQGKRKNTKLASTAKHKRGPMARKLRQQQVRGELSGELLTRTEKKKGGERLRAAALEIKRDLPNGVMAISPGTPWGQANASSSVVRKLGSNDGYLLGRLFRSKNAERVPLAKVQKLPFFRSMKGRRKRACHRCRASENKGVGRILCLSCKEFFCTTCIETWHSELSEFEVKESCPVCRGCCSCINCNSRRDEDGGSNVASYRVLSQFE